MILTLLSDEVLLYNFIAGMKVAIVCDAKNSEIDWKAGSEDKWLDESDLV